MLIVNDTKFDNIMFISPSLTLPRAFIDNTGVGGPDLVLYRRRKAEFCED
jgi:hypothetical protein